MTMPELLIEYPDGERQPGYGSRSDLTRYLYSAGATLRSNVAYSKIANEELGEPLSSRIDLIVAIKEELETRLHSGQSISSLPHYLATLLPFLRFLEDGNYSFALANLETNYLEYAEYQPSTP